LTEEWEAWRLVVLKVATLTELNTTWSLEDIEKANAVLEIKDAIEEALMPSPPPPP